VKAVFLIMVTTHHLCAACGSEQIRRNGSAAGHAKYPCKACGHQARFVPAAMAKAVQYAQVDKLLLERNSQRSIVRVTGVSRTTVAGRVKKSLAGLASLAPLAAETGAKKAVGGART
jgi:transposase-like protein